MGVRRPNTNRLGAGGYLAVNLNGGSLSVDSSAFTGNYDDLTVRSLYFLLEQMICGTASRAHHQLLVQDLGAVVGYASGQPAANQVWFYLPMQVSPFT